MERERAGCSKNRQSHPSYLTERPYVTDFVEANICVTIQVDRIKVAEGNRTGIIVRE